MAEGREESPPTHTQLSGDIRTLCALPATSWPVLVWAVGPSGSRWLLHLFSSWQLRERERKGAKKESASQTDRQGGRSGWALKSECFIIYLKSRRRRLNSPIVCGNQKTRSIWRHSPLRCASLSVHVCVCVWLRLAAFIKLCVCVRASGTARERENEYSSFMTI